MDANSSRYYNESVYGFESGLKVKGEDLDSVHISSKGVQSSDQQLSPFSLASPSFSLPFVAQSPKSRRAFAREDSIETCCGDQSDESYMMDGYMSKDVDQFTNLNIYDQEELLSAYNQIYPETSYVGEINSATMIMNSFLSTTQDESSSNLPRFVNDNFDETVLFQTEEQTFETLPFPVPVSQGKPTALKKSEGKPCQNPIVAAKVITNIRKRGNSSGEQNKIIITADDKASGAPTKRKRLSKDERNSKSKRGSFDDDIEEDDAYDASADKSRNAINAKINREKKKAYAAELEAEVKRLTAENGKLTADASRACGEREACVREIQYLTNVLVTQSALSKLLTGLNNMGGADGMHGRRSSLFVVDGDQIQPAPTGSDHDYHHHGLGQGHFLGSTVMSIGNGGLTSGGICLHVDTNRVSLELCACCEQQAAQ